MIKRQKVGCEMVKRQSGFTLIEMLIVIIVLGILAMIIVPQITVSTDDAKVSTLQSNLAGIRSAIEVYYVQHGNVYPGEVKTDGAATANDGDAATAFVQQLTRYTMSSGSVGTAKNTTYKYGPYIKQGQMPANPFNTNTAVTADYDQTVITAARTPSGTGGYRVYPKTGVVFANDDGASGGVDHETY